MIIMSNIILKVDATKGYLNGEKSIYTKTVKNQFILKQ